MLCSIYLYYSNYSCFCFCNQWVLIMSNARFIPVYTEDGTQLVLKVVPVHTFPSGKVEAVVQGVMYRDPEEHSNPIAEIPSPPAGGSIA